LLSASAFKIRNSLPASRQAGSILILSQPKDIFQGGSQDGQNERPLKCLAHINKQAPRSLGAEAVIDSDIGV
jgi:hypothetical protein